jgi:hypothetical protein
VAWHQDITYWGLEPPIAHTDRRGRQRYRQRVYAGDSRHP